MLNRVSDLAEHNQNQALVRTIQTRMYETQIQISTGKKSQRYEGVAEDATRLINLKADHSAATRFIENNQVVDQRLAAMEDRVAALIELATSYKAFLVNASSGSNAADMAFATHSEAELERAAQRSARTKVDVLAAMSHELRTPLNAIIGLAEMSAEERVGALDPRYRSYFEDIRNAGQHLLSIINQIYDAIRIDTDQMRIELAPANVAELVSSARALIAHAASSRGVHIDDVATDSRERVLCDAVRTRQVLVNLLNNAVKFTKPGGRVGIDVASANDREIDITVWDTGIGIPKDKQKQVFDSYFRVSDGAKTTDGIGLGLWISRNLADRMGGSLRLTSEVGLGTRITLRLKRAPLPKT